MTWFDHLLKLHATSKRQCSFCDLPESQHRPLVEGPNDVFICRCCCDAVEMDSDVGNCSFCRMSQFRREAEQRLMLTSAASDVSICKDCLELASSIFEQTSQRESHTTHT